MLQRRLALLSRLVLVTAVAALLASASGAPAAAPESVHTKTLANGMRIVVVENHAAPVVETAMWYGFGALQERSGKTGLAHALAHMMYRGTPSLSGSGLDDVFTQLGAREVATTSNDFTEYHFVLPSDKLGLALRVEADRMQHLLIDDATWKSEKAAVLSEREDDLSTPLATLYDQVCRAATATPICTLSALGDRKDIANASAEDLRSYYQDYYAPNDATLVIAGDVSTADAFKLAGDAFESVPRNAPPPDATTPVVYGHERQVETVGDFPDEVVDLAFAAPGSADPDAAAFTILDSIVNNPRSDFHKGLLNSGYTLGYSTQWDQNAHSGLYHVFLVVAPGHESAQARDAFVGIMTGGERNGFSADLIAAAKTAAERQDLYSRDSIAGLANRVGYAFAVNGWSDPSQGDRAIAAVNPDAVAAAARKFLDEPIVQGVLTPGSVKSASLARPPKAAVTDDFSRRPPAGQIVEAPWVRDALATPSEVATRAVPQSFTLDNGLHLLFVPVRSNATVFIQGSVDTSPRFDPRGKEGLGAMTSSLLTYGGAKYDFDAVHKTVDDIGASLDLGFAFDAHARSSDFDKLLDVLADDLIHPAFAKTDIEHVRSDTLAAISARDGDPDYHAGHEFLRLLLGPNDPELREPLVSSIDAIKQADLKGYAKAYVRPDVTTIAVVGDLDPATVRQRVEAAFGKWTATGKRPYTQPDPIPPTQPARQYVVADRRSVAAHLGERAPGRNDPDFFPLELLNEILGADAAYDTRLMAQLRTRYDLVYAADSTYEPERYRGSFEEHFYATPAHLADARTKLREQLERMQRDPVGPFELARARSKLIARTRVAEESTEVIAERVEDIGVSGLPLDYEATLPEKYGAVDGAALLRVALRYLHPNALIEVDEGPRP